MTQEQVRLRIVSFFAARWPQAIPVAHENQPFTEPSGVTWTRLSIAQGDRGPASLGTGHMRCLGVVYLQIFTPENKGTKPGLDVADKFAEIFDLASIAEGTMEIQFDSVQTVKVGKTQQTLFQINASVGYRADSWPA